MFFGSSSRIFYYSHRKHFCRCVFQTAEHCGFILYCLAGVEKQFSPEFEFSLIFMKWLNGKYRSLKASRLPLWSSRSLKQHPLYAKRFFKAPLQGQKETASNLCGGGAASHKRRKTTKGQIAQCKKWSSYNRKRRKSHCCLCPGVVLQWKEREGLRGDTERTDHPSACHQLQTVFLMWEFILWWGSLCGCRVTQHTLASHA